MTVHIPLAPDVDHDTQSAHTPTAATSLPEFVHPSLNGADDLQAVAQAIARARRIVVVLGSLSSPAHIEEIGRNTNGIGVY